MIASVWTDEEPQVLFAVTVIFPLAEPAVALIELEVDVPDHPDGNVHVYEVAPLTGVIEYVLITLSQVVVLPAMLPGVAGIALTVYVSVFEAGCAGVAHILLVVITTLI